MSAACRDGQVWAVCPSAVPGGAPCYSTGQRFPSLVSNASIWTTFKTHDPTNQHLDRTLSIEIDEGLAKKQIEVKKAKEKAAVDLADLEWHTLAVHELCRRLSVDIEQGLSEDRTKRRLSEHGQEQNDTATLGTMLPDQCIVVHNGSHVGISALDLVPGDVIVIKQGNKLPADVRFVDISSDSMFDRAILTGESEPIRSYYRSNRRQLS
ncbi:unnamed protein product [Alternaria alternata]